MLGSTFMRLLAERGSAAVALDRRAFLDASPDERTAMLARYDLVLHAAANTDVERCETEPEQAYFDNCHLTAELFRHARRHGAKFVFVSSTGVYGRAKRDPYHEYDVPAPTTVHHRSKRLAEQLVLADPEGLVVRTGWLFGGDLDNKKNFVNNRIAEARRASGEMVANTGQVGSPTFADDCAGKVLVNTGVASRYDYVRTIVELSGAPVKVSPIEASGFNRVADVSENEAAISYRLRLEGYGALRPWSEALADYMRARGLIGCLA
jgi:dTDP-4-dehydrorhamnose reductase